MIIPVETKKEVVENLNTKEPVKDPVIEKTVPKVETTTPTPLKPAPTPAPSNKPTSITLEQVAMHNTRESCWSAINGVVYDLTSWIPNHPGGEKRILNLCGIDGTLSFNGKHGGSTKVMKILTGFTIGTL